MDINEVAPNDDLYDILNTSISGRFAYIREACHAGHCVYEYRQCNSVCCISAYLVSKDTTDSAFVGVGGTVPTISLPTPDIAYLSSDQSTLINQHSALLWSALFRMTCTISTQRSLARYNDDAIHFSGEYFAPLEIYGTSKAYSLMMPSWTEYSLIEAINFSFEDELVEVTSENTLRDAYALADCIKKILAAIDPCHLL